MAKKLTDFTAQYNALGLQAPEEGSMTPREKAEIIFHAACKVTGKDPAALPQVYHLDEEFRPSLVASYMLQVIRKALIGKWVPDWNSYQRKWGSDFLMNAPGFRLYVVCYDFSFTFWSGGSLLCCETEVQAEFLATECIALWADFYGGELAA